MLTKIISGLILSTVLVSCVANDADNAANTTPIDSTSMHGDAPVTYGGNDPASVQDTIIQNSTDTGTAVTNGPDNTVDPNQTPNR